MFPNFRRGGTAIAADSGSYTLRLERKVARALLPGFETALLRVLRPDSPGLMLLRQYCEIVMSQQQLTAGLARIAGDHLGALLAQALADAGAAGSRSLCAARLVAIKDDILANLDSADLSVGAIAVRHRMTRRYVQMLFEREDETFREYVLGQRLARAHRLLSDPLRVQQKITSIALDCGFGDVSYFNQVFRRRFGATPSEIRAQARRDQ